MKGAAALLLLLLHQQQQQQQNSKYLLSLLYRKIGKETFWEKAKTEVFWLFLSKQILFPWLPHELPHRCIHEGQCCCCCCCFCLCCCCCYCFTTTTTTTTTAAAAEEVYEEGLCLEMDKLIFRCTDTEELLRLSVAHRRQVYVHNLVSLLQQLTLLQQQQQQTQQQQQQQHQTQQQQHKQQTLLQEQQTLLQPTEQQQQQQQEAESKERETAECGAPQEGSGGPRGPSGDLQDPF
ncbi:hypothetical protein, conserved, partial [Eimeria tenella]